MLNTRSCDVWWRSLWKLCPLYTVNFVYDFAKRLAASHYNDVKLGVMASQISGLTIVYSNVYSGADQWKHQSSASLTFVCGIHRWPKNSPHKGSVARKMFPFENVIMGVYTLLYRVVCLILNVLPYWEAEKSYVIHMFIRYLLRTISSKYIMENLFSSFCVVKFSAVASRICNPRTEQDIEFFTWAICEEAYG